MRIKIERNNGHFKKYTDPPFKILTVNSNLFILPSFSSYGRVYATADPYHHTIGPAATYSVGTMVNHFYFHHEPVIAQTQILLTSCANVYKITRAVGAQKQQKWLWQGIDESVEPHEPRFNIDSVIKVWSWGGCGFCVVTASTVYEPDNWEYFTCLILLIFSGMYQFVRIIKHWISLS